jgi:hypothetical protein
VSFPEGLLRVGGVQMAMNEHGPFKFCVTIFVQRPPNSTSFRYHSSSYVSVGGEEVVGGSDSDVAMVEGESRRPGRSDRFLTLTISFDPKYEIY